MRWLDNWGEVTWLTYAIVFTFLLMYEVWKAHGKRLWLDNWEDKTWLQALAVAFPIFLIFEILESGKQQPTGADLVKVGKRLDVLDYDRARRPVSWEEKVVSMTKNLRTTLKEWTPLTLTLAAIVAAGVFIGKMFGLWAVLAFVLFVVLVFVVVAIDLFVRVFSDNHFGIIPYSWDEFQWMQRARKGERLRRLRQTIAEFEAEIEAKRLVTTHQERGKLLELYRRRRELERELGKIVTKPRFRQTFPKAVAVGDPRLQDIVLIEEAV